MLYVVVKWEKQLLSGGADGLIVVWNVKEDNKYKVVKGHQGVVQNIANINKNKIV